MFNPENEITLESEDRLNRNKFARNLANNILNYNHSDCLTIGVTGSWGSGKSSLINLTLKKFKCEKDILIIHFKPWFFSNQNNLYYQFFRLLISTLKNYELNKESLFKRKTNPKRKMFKKSKIENLEDYFNYIQNSNSIFNENHFYSLNSEDLESYTSLDTLKKGCDDYFDKLNCKIIVVIDDIDRLLENEIKQIFTLVKSLANFKKFIYVLSFDKTIVGEALNDSDSDYKDKFLEKIVQIQIRVPDIPPSKIYELIVHDIKPIYDEYLTKSVFNENDDFYELSICLAYFINNIRDLKRYINLLNFYLNRFVDNINLNDCFLILALQLFEYKIYLALKYNKRILTRKITIDPTNKNNLVNMFYEELEEMIEKLTMPELYEVLKILFPILKYQYNENYPPSLFKELSKNHKVGHEKHFDKYFTFSLETSEVNMNKLNKLTEPNKHNFYELFSQNDWKYNENLFYELNNLVGKIPKENCESLIIKLMEMGDAIKVFRTGRDELNYLFDNLFKKLESKEKFYYIFEKCISFNNNIYTVSDYTHHLSVKNRTITNGEDLIFTESDLNKIEKMTLNKIKKCSEDGELFQHRYLTNILNIWKQFENDEYVIKNYVLSKTGKDYNLIEFLKKYNISDYEYSIIDEDILQKDVFDFKGIKTHYFESLRDEYFKEIIELNNRVMQISNDKNTLKNHKSFCRKFNEEFEEYKRKSYDFIEDNEIPE